jgi:hypothetical protein
MMRCAYCQKELGQDYVEYLGYLWHPNCLEKQKEEARKKVRRLCALVLTVASLFLAATTNIL